MNIVFLDIDGVLNNLASSAMGVSLINEKAMLVARLCSQTKASVVVSSSWKILYNLKTLQEMLWRVGVSGVDILDVTPNIHDIGTVRGDEIKAWLNQHPNVENYVILDDNSDMLEEQLPHFVQTDHHFGLTWTEVDRAEEILNGNLRNLNE